MSSSCILARPHIWANPPAKLNLHVLTSIACVLFSAQCLPELTQRIVLEFYYSIICISSKDLFGSKYLFTTRWLVDCYHLILILSARARRTWARISTAWKAPSPIIVWELCKPDYCLRALPGKHRSRARVRWIRQSPRAARWLMESPAQWCSSSPSPRKTGVCGQADTTLVSRSFWSLFWRCCKAWGSWIVCCPCTSSSPFQGTLEDVSMNYMVYEFLIC